ncbi:MAG TPA: hypothetical protein VFS20_32175 [Longimicrobium sp.]|nr:hypothetical protein [Longimicrobium sp.]
MRKIRLEIDDLVVETIDTVAAPRHGGTVRGNSAHECDTRGYNPTCDWFASCAVDMECEATGVEYSCRPGVTDCL